MNDLIISALLLDGPKYGYQIKREAGWVLGQEALHNNLVYPMLRKFLDEGWVSKKAVPGERGQTRQQYALTKEGRRRLFERLNQFSEMDAATEGAFHLRVGLFAALKPQSREAILAARENFLRNRDQKLAALQANVEMDSFPAEVVAHLRKQNEIDREWIQHLRRMTKGEDRRRRDP
jgi:DNA-binding PadR family transcriptional regulator